MTSGRPTRLAGTQTVVSPRVPGPGPEASLELRPPDGGQFLKVYSRDHLMAAGAVPPSLSPHSPTAKVDNMM
jgi:hypothetical protein